MKKEAYELGVHLALADAALIPMEKVAVIPEIIGAVAAPEGEGWRGASGAALGTSIGGSLGGLAGGGLGYLGGGLLGKALDMNSQGTANVGAGIGAGLGALGGGIYGGIKGYGASVMDEEKKREMLRKAIEDRKMADQLANRQG